MENINSNEDATEHLRRKYRRTESPVNTPVNSQDTITSDNSVDLEEQNNSNKDMPEIHESLKKGIIAYEDKSLKIIAKSVAHAKSSIFSLEDHLYTMRLELKEKKQVPFLLNLEEALEKALIFVLDELKKRYPKDKHHQVDVCIAENRIRSGLNSGHWDLATPSKKLARHCVTLLYNFLKSNASFKLTPSFQVYFKILSTKHEKSLIRKKNWKKHVFKPFYH
jgi:hypothetical protein